MGVADFAVGPDGALYYVSQFNGSIQRIAYTASLVGPTKTYTVSPCRILDTRAPGGGGPLAANTCRPINVMDPRVHRAGLQYAGFPGRHRGSPQHRCGGPSGPGHLTAYPYGWSAPLASVINFGMGKDIANGVLIPLCDSAVSTCTNDILIQAGPA